MKLRRLIAVIILNIVIVVTEIIFGVIGNSLGLVADAIHNFSDVIALGISFIALKYAEREVSEKMTYGYIRSEMMAGFVNSIFLILAMMYVVFESVKKLLSPEPVQGVTMMIVAGVAVLANGLSVMLLRGAGVGHACHHGHDHEREHGHDLHGENCEVVAHEDVPRREVEDMNIRAATLHLLSDVAISAAVILGGLAITLWQIPAIDPIISILFAVYITIKGIGILRATFFSLMDRTDGNLNKIVEAMKEFPEIENIHGVHMTHPSSKDTLFTAHIVVPSKMPMEEVENLLERIREKLKTMGITHIVIQPETRKYARDTILCDGH
ncbi:MAG: cation transporter [Brevinematales bacterium]|nr:cation transporter [Brevinematales bacterium]